MATDKELAQAVIKALKARDAETGEARGMIGTRRWQNELFKTLGGGNFGAGALEALKKIPEISRPAETWEKLGVEGILAAFEKAGISPQNMEQIFSKELSQDQAPEQSSKQEPRQEPGQNQSNQRGGGRGGR